MFKEERIKRNGLVFVFLAIAFSSVAQVTRITGVVKDAVTKQPLYAVSVTIKNRNGVPTDSLGNFTISSDRQISQLQFSIVGYKSQTVSIKSPKDTLFVFMQPNGSVLNTVVIKNKKQKYRNKDNPAVELIRRVIDNKPKNRIESYQYAQYEKYEKMQISLDNVSEKVKNSKLTKKYHFLFENADTAMIPGKALLPVYLEEKISREYYRASPQKSKSIIVAHKRVDFGEFVDMRGVSNYLNRLYAEVNIYDNNIPLFTNLFLSPIADMGPTFYMYFIADTVVEDNQKFVRLTFRPRNPNDFLFRGTLYVTLDGNYAVQKFTMFTSKNINLNFVRELRISQDFVKREDGRYLLSKSSVIGDLGIFKKGSGVFGQRTVSYKDFISNQPIADSIFKGPPIVEYKEPASVGQDSFWLMHRHDTLTKAESKVYANIDSLKNMPSFRRLMDWATLLLAGYKQAGPFEIGPASTFYSFNPVEGFRLRFGGRTTPKFSNRMYFETYAAYGFKDEKWKYFFSSTYSLNNKSVYSFPLNYIRASYQRETKIPGQELQFVQEDNFLLSFKRGDNDKWLYNDYFKLNYVYEFGNHFSYDFGLKYWKQFPAGSLMYISQQNGDTIKSITTGEASVQFRWAPNEQFYQGKLYRIPIINKYPVFTFRYIAGIKGLFGGQYNYQNITLNIFKRFYLSQFGYTDVTAEGGYLFGKVPWPLADLPHANQTYAYQLNSYNMMNFLEFIGDHYVSIDVDHYFNGFIFNKIPLLKKLKWREVIEGKLLYGGLRNENNPAMSTDQLKFPTGESPSYPLGGQPYIEAGFGIANIFKLVRVDLIKRFTYLNHSNIPDPPLAIRARVKFDF
ncbi:MAG: carboxypeptidase-like regulatory domain-containing protein [Bacteroidetes bacterium]|nr:carboxypeptidase-like regulatory domain-containing protein [Bacteroidota bacterium]